MTKHKEETWFTCDIFIVLIMSVYKKHAKIASLYALVHIYIELHSVLSQDMLFCVCFLCIFLNSYIQINAAEYRRL